MRSLYVRFRVVFIQVSIVGLSKTQYNLSVSAELIKTPGFTVQEIVAASTHHVRIHQVQKRIREMRLTIRLGQRKLKLAVRLLRKVRFPPRHLLLSFHPLHQA